MSPPFFLSKISQQLVYLRHSVRLQLGEDEAAVEHDLKGPGRPEGTLQHVEAEIAAEEDDHFLLLEALVERVLVDGWDECAADAEEEEAGLDRRGCLAEEGSQGRKRIRLADDKDLGPEVADLLLQLLKGLAVGSTRAVLHQQHRSLLVLLSAFTLSLLRKLSRRRFLLPLFSRRTWSTVDAILLRSLDNCGCLRGEHPQALLQSREGDTKQDEAAEKELDILFSSLHNIYKMGCEVTSVYNDEITGKVGYNKRIVDDLLKRDFRKAYVMESEKVKKEVARVEGFTQSFAIGRICFATVAGVEWAVYNAGRFIVLDGVGTEARKHLAHRDLVTAFSISGKLALAGTYGGELTLWDLEFA